MDLMAAAPLICLNGEAKVEFRLDKQKERVNLEFGMNEESENKEWMLAFSLPLLFEEVFVLPLDKNQSMRVHAQNLRDLLTRQLKISTPSVEGVAHLEQQLQALAQFIQWVYLAQQKPQSLFPYPHQVAVYHPDAQTWGMQWGKVFRLEAKRPGYSAQSTSEERPHFQELTFSFLSQSILTPILHMNLIINRCEF